MADPVEADLRRVVAGGDAVVLIGAGVAISATGSPVASWLGLLENGIEQCIALRNVPAGWADVQRAQLKLGDVESLLAVAEQITHRLGGHDGGEFRRWLHTSVGALEASDSRILNALLALQAPLMTTNYDGLLEQIGGREWMTWRDGNRVQQVLRGDDAGIVHVHGHWRDPDSVILGIRSYEEIRAAGPMQALLRGLATMRHLILIGFGTGLEDPNFSALRNWMAETWEGSEYRHFRLVSENERDAATAMHKPSERVVQVAYGVDHSDLPKFLESLQPARRRPPAAYPSSGEPRPSRPTLPAVPLCLGRDTLIEGVVAAVVGPTPVAVPILGPPGIGKSALSLACAHDSRVVAHFGSRRYFIRCDGATSRGGLVTEIGEALGIAASSALESHVLAQLAAEPTLLILDNLEVPWTADLQAVEGLLGQVGAIEGNALICSIRGAERPQGPQWHNSLTVPPLPAEAAKQVFLAASGERFSNDPYLDALLIDLDGMPIAIELLGVLSQAEPDLAGIRRRWARKRTDILTRGNDPDRHLSVAVSFELSIGGAQVTEAARDLLSLLSVLPDGVAHRDFGALMGDRGDEAAASLRGAALAFDEADRLRVLKPIRDHVAQHHPPTRSTVWLVADHFVDLCSRLAPELKSEQGSDARRLLLAEMGNLQWALEERLRSEASGAAIDATVELAELGRLTGINFASLLELATSAARRLDDGPRIAAALFYRGLIASERADTVGRGYLGEALTLYREIGNVVGQANCIHCLGTLEMRRSNASAAEEHFERARPLYRETGDVLGEANCVHSLGDISLRRSQHAVAREHYDQALPLYRKVGTLRGEAHCIKRLGDIALRQSDLPSAREHYDYALPLYRRMGDVFGEANCIKSLGDIAFRLGDHLGARDHYERALRIYRQVQDVLGEANSIKSLADISRVRSELEAAEAGYENALPRYRDIGDILGEANCIKGLGDVARQRFDYHQARGRFEDALPRYRQIGDVVGEANCIRSLGDVAIGESAPAHAAARYKTALPLYRKVGDVLGEANTFDGFGRVAVLEGNAAAARRHYEAALVLYEQFQDTYSVGRTQFTLATLSENQTEREDRISAGRAAWSGIGLDDEAEEITRILNVPEVAMPKPDD